MTKGKQMSSPLPRIETNRTPPKQQDPASFDAPNIIAPAGDPEVAETSTQGISEISFITISLPILEGVGEGYVSNRVDISLDRKQAKVLRKIQAGLEERNEKLANGRNVRCMGDALKWMIESTMTSHP